MHKRVCLCPCDIPQGVHCTPFSSVFFHRPSTVSPCQFALFQRERKTAANADAHKTQTNSALVVRGRYAGKKVVIIKPHDEGSKSHPFPHALVAGVERYPLQVSADMDSKKIAKRTKVKPFIKVVNYNHLMPTRYTLELGTLKNVIGTETFQEPSLREDAKKTIKLAFEERHKSGKNKWFFTKLRF